MSQEQEIMCQVLNRWLASRAQGYALYKDIPHVDRLVHLPRSRYRLPCGVLVLHATALSVSENLYVQTARHTCCTACTRFWSKSRQACAPWVPRLELVSSGSDPPSGVCRPCMTSTRALTHNQLSLLHKLSTVNLPSRLDL